jgi:hypothetical protein
MGDSRYTRPLAGHHVIEPDIEVVGEASDGTIAARAGVRRT